jgi:putative nucleotidyltransferase with HDIG domain
MATAESTLRKIRSEQLRPGMYLHQLCGSWMQHPFWRTSFLIRDAGQIETIIDSGIEEVWIDCGKGEAPVEPGLADDRADAAVDAPPDPAAASPIAADSAESQESTPRRRAPGNGQDPTATPFEEEMLRARRICESSRQAVVALFQEARLGHAVQTTAALRVVDDITASVMRNPNALISVARLKNADDYTYLHSVAVSALMVALARQLGMDEAGRRQAALGGLLHDVGKARIPTALLNKTGSLDEAEFEIIRGHPRHGHELLQEAAFGEDAALDVVLHHHERFDGTGYPDRLAGEETARLARMGAICDVYDAVTSDRPYKRGWDPALSIHRMHSWKGHFDATLLQHFVKLVGIYPIGSLVRLESDKLGVVCEPPNGSLLKPTVRTFFSARTKRQIPMHDVDLAAPGCVDRVVGIEAPASWGFKNLERLWTR